MERKPPAKHVSLGQFQYYRNFAKLKTVRLSLWSYSSTYYICKKWTTCYQPDKALSSGLSNFHGYKLLTVILVKHTAVRKSMKINSLT